jgi:hypothetical protein
MDGVDLVTEGIITMTKSMEYLDRGIIPESNNAAALLAKFCWKAMNYLYGRNQSESGKPDPFKPEYGAAPIDSEKTCSHT